MQVQNNSSLKTKLCLAIINIIKKLQNLLKISYSTNYELINNISLSINKK